MSGSISGIQAEVVSLKGYRNEMIYDPIADLEGYWEDLRGTRVVPMRSELDPTKFERALDCTFLLERIAPGLARFRLAGMRLNELMGMEVRGMPLTSILTPSARDEFRETLEFLFEGPNVVSASIQSESAIGRPELRGKMVILPLKSDLGDISRAVGCLSVDGSPGLTPRRFNVVSTTYRAVSPFKTEQPTSPSPKAPALEQGFAEAPESYAAPEKRGRPKLRVISNDRLGKPAENPNGKDTENP